MLKKFSYLQRNFLSKVVKYHPYSLPIRSFCSDDQARAASVSGFNNHLDSYEKFLKGIVEKGKIDMMKRINEISTSSQNQFKSSIAESIENVREELNDTKNDLIKSIDGKINTKITEVDNKIKDIEEKINTKQSEANKKISDMEVKMETYKRDAAYIGLFMAIVFFIDYIRKNYYLINNDTNILANKILTLENSVVETIPNEVTEIKNSITLLEETVNKSIPDEMDKIGNSILLLEETVNRMSHGEIDKINQEFDRNKSTNNVPQLNILTWPEIVKGSGMALLALAAGYLGSRIP